MLLKYIVALVVAALAVLLGIIIGDYGPWYMCWFLGTGFMVLVAASAGVLFEAQEDAAAEGGPVGVNGIVGVVAGNAPTRPSGGTRA